MSVGNEIPHVIELAGSVLVHHLLIADGREPHRIPVDHAHTSIYKTLVVEIDEGVDHCLAQVRVHSELSPVPVARCTELAELTEDDASMLFLPFPSVPHELIAGEILLAYALCLELCHDLAFRCD